MWLRVGAMVARYMYLYRRSLARSGEVFFWPVMELLVWGFLMTYLRRHMLPAAIVWLLGGLIFWDVLYRSQQAITLSLSEDIWAKNLVNLFIAPISVFELLLATCFMGVIKATITILVLGTLASVLYAFNILTIGAALLPFMLVLLLFGWALGTFTMGLILRFGKAAEALVWGIPFLVQPFSAVFYPVDVLPQPLRAGAYLLPSTYVFEGMRAVIRDGAFDLRTLGIAFGLNLVYLGLGSLFFGLMLRVVRERGHISRLGME